jgi:transglutaminase-like putative cysteine protease
MRYSLGCRLGYRVTEPTSFVFNVEVARIPQQRVLHERLVVTPEVPLETYVMPESGNRYVRLLAQPGPILLSYEAEVDLLVHRADPATVGETPLPELAFEVLPHLYPSRYCQSDRLERAAQSDFGQTERGHARVTALCNWIYEWIDYSRGTSDAHTSACDTLIDRAGVCRDFAHLGIALCRAMGIPARFVSAYAYQLQPPDFHAVFEAWIGDRWYLFDPTRQAALDGIVRIGVGRDASEVSFASIHGGAEPTEMEVRIEAAEEDRSSSRTTDAISTATR